VGTQRGPSSLILFPITANQNGAYTRLCVRTTGELTQNRAHRVPVTAWDIYQEVPLEISGRRRYRSESLVGIGSECLRGCLKEKDH
jgi:hypothetical protein